MCACMGRLRLSPRDFWSSTPREIAAMLKPHTIALSTGQQALSRAALDSLLLAFPDFSRPEIAPI